MLLAPDSSCHITDTGDPASKAQQELIDVSENDKGSGRFPQCLSGSLQCLDTLASCDP